MPSPVFPDWYNKSANWRIIFELSLYKMNVKTNILEEYVIFVDSTKKQNLYLTRTINLLVVIVSLALTFRLKIYLNE